MLNLKKAELLPFQMTVYVKELQSGVTSAQAAAVTGKSAGLEAELWEVLGKTESS